jgi:glycosyltransferase involved in cell wall biosynthesis
MNEEMTPPPLSLCIATMRRWSFLKDYIPEYLKNPYITEIIITDETGEDAREIQAAFTDSRIKVHVNEHRLGAYLNKYKAVSLASNEWVCLMDSDNFAPVSYFDAWAKLLNGRIPNKESECFFPSKALPALNYTHFIGTPITKDNYKAIWRLRQADAMFNTGNYIVPRDLYCRSVSTPELANYDTSCLALDVQFRNYFLLMNGAIFHIVPDMEYSHVVHSGSFYVTTCSSINRTPFDALYR